MKKNHWPSSRTPNDSSDSHGGHAFIRLCQGNVNRTLERLDSCRVCEVAWAGSSLIPRTGFSSWVDASRGSNGGIIFSNHLQIIRPAGLRCLDFFPSAMAAILAEWTQGAVLIVFDIRRYEKELDKAGGSSR